jgi:hypothetical protein
MTRSTNQTMERVAGPTARRIYGETRSAAFCIESAFAVRSLRRVRATRNDGRSTSYSSCFKAETHRVCMVAAPSAAVDGLPSMRRLGPMRSARSVSIAVIPEGYRPVIVTLETRRIAKNSHVPFVVRRRASYQHAYPQPGRHHSPMSRTGDAERLARQNRQALPQPSACSSVVPLRHGAQLLRFDAA